MMKLDGHELQQLLALFYELRGDDEVVVDLDVAPLKEDIDEIVRNTQDKSASQAKVRSVDIRTDWPAHILSTCICVLDLS